MINYVLPFLSIVIGYLIVFALKPKNQRNIKLLLAFSGAFLLAMTIYKLIPEVYHIHELTEGVHGDDDVKNGIGVWIVVGILLQIVLEFFSKGAEHGHMHSEKVGTDVFSWLLFVSLSIHAILEGFPLHQHNGLVYGIFVHHLPIAMILTIFFLNSGASNIKTFVFLFLFSLATPFGTFLADFVPEFGKYSREMSAVVIGIFLHISSVILFESSESHKFNFYKLSVIVLGFVIAYFV